MRERLPEVVSALRFSVKEVGWRGKVDRLGSVVEDLLKDILSRNFFRSLAGRSGRLGDPDWLGGSLDDGVRKSLKRLNTPVFS